jgi:hypothetical protein
MARGAKRTPISRRGQPGIIKASDQIQKAQAASTNMGHTPIRLTAVTVVHGESDHVANNGPYYAGYLKAVAVRLPGGCPKALTGQSNSVPMFFCQMSSHTKYNATTSLIPGAQLWASEISRLSGSPGRFALPASHGICLIRRR